MAVASTPLFRLRRRSAQLTGLGAACILAALAAALGGAGPTPAKPPTEIVLGMSTALSGPAADLGTEMRRGVLAALNQVNADGGVQGRPVRLIALDDGYEPSRAGPNMRKLIADEHVTAVVGNVGTPTAVVAIPIANETGTPFVGAFTGAGVLRKSPPDKCVINFRASYAEETGAMVDALIDTAGLTPADVGFFTQRDAYGDAGFAGGLAALRRHGLPEDAHIPHGRYERNTLAVENGLADLLAESRPPKAVIMVGAYAPCARFIQLAHEVGLRSIFLNVSFVGASSLAKAAGESGDGVIVTQVVPHLESDQPIVLDYRQALAALNEEGSPPATYGSLEGYIVARMLCRAMTSATDPADRKAVTEALERMGKFDLGLGVPLELSPTEHQACHTVWPTILRAGTVVPFDWRTLAAAGSTGTP